MFSVRYNGTKSDFSPDPRPQESAVPGELVKAAFPIDLNNAQDEKRLSGTSVIMQVKLNNEEIARFANALHEYAIKD